MCLFGLKGCAAGISYFVEHVIIFVRFGHQSHLNEDAQPQDLAVNAMVTYLPYAGEVQSIIRYTLKHAKLRSREVVSFLCPSRHSPVSCRLA
jgi:hypothetical protein